MNIPSNQRNVYTSFNLLALYTRVCSHRNVGLTSLDLSRLLHRILTDLHATPTDFSCCEPGAYPLISRMRLAVGKLLVQPVPPQPRNLAAPNGDVLEAKALQHVQFLWQRLPMHTCSQWHPVLNWAIVLLTCLLVAWVMYKLPSELSVQADV